MFKRMGCVRAAVFGALFVGLGGCAWVDAVPAPPGSDVSGIRIYDIKPLLVVSSAGVDVVFVPNYNRAYAVRFGAFMAKHDLTIEFQNGTIGKIVSNQDSTAVPIAFLATINKALETGKTIGGAFAGKADASGGRLQVYDLVFDELGNLVAVRPILADEQLIRVPTVVGGVVAGKGGKDLTGGTPNAEQQSGQKDGTQKGVQKGSGAQQGGGKGAAKGDAPVTPMPDPKQK